MYIGFDIGGTAVKYGIIDEEGNIIEKAKIATVDDCSIICNSLLEIISSKKETYDLKGIGISAPGIIRQDGHMITAGAIRSLYGKNLKTELEKETNLPVYVENDANAVAIAEKWIGNAQSMKNYLCIVIGTGIGGGIVIENNVYRGAHGMAGEFGWMMLDELPEQGNLEAVSGNLRASTVSGLVRIYNESCEPNREIVEAREIFTLAENGDSYALKVTGQFYRDLSVIMMNLISLFDPEAILIGGGISENEYFLTHFQKTLLELETRHEPINYLLGKTIAPVIPTKLKNDAGLLGAVYQVHRFLSKK